MTTLALLATLLFAAADVPPQSVLVVVGAGGNPEYARRFREWADRWQIAAAQGGALLATVGIEGDQDNDAVLLEQQLQQQEVKSSEPLWIVFIGHGTYDGRAAKFNLRGPDVSAQQLAEWLERFERPLAIVNCASASGPFINRLSGPNRVIVTATKSGFQHNYARFGDSLSAAIGDPAADLDKDEQTSLLEAFLFASARVSEFYEQEGRLATEHALIDDTGDSLGTQADWFRGVRAVRAAKDGAAVDGLRANQFCLIRSAREQRLPPEVRARRDALELEIARLRETKSKLGEDDYYLQLEPILVELAQLYEDAEAAAPQPPEGT